MKTLKLTLLSTVLLMAAGVSAQSNTVGRGKGNAPRVQNVELKEGYPEIAAQLRALKAKESKNVILTQPVKKPAVIKVVDSKRVSK